MIGLSASDIKFSLDLVIFAELIYLFIAVFDVIAVITDLSKKYKKGLSTGTHICNNISSRVENGS